MGLEDEVDFARWDEVTAEGPKPEAPKTISVQIDAKTGVQRVLGPVKPDQDIKDRDIGGGGAQENDLDEK